MTTQVISWCSLAAASICWLSPVDAGLIFPQKPRIRIHQSGSTLNIQNLQGKSGWQPFKDIKEVAYAGISPGSDGKSQTLFLFNKDGNLIDQAEVLDVEFSGGVVKPLSNSLWVTGDGRDHKLDKVVLIPPDRIPKEQPSTTQPEYSTTESRSKDPIKTAATLGTVAATACAVIAVSSDSSPPKSTKLRDSIGMRNAFEACDVQKYKSTLGKVFDRLSSDIPNR